MMGKIFETLHINESKFVPAKVDILMFGFGTTPGEGDAVVSLLKNYFDEDKTRDLVKIQVGGKKDKKEGLLTFHDIEKLTRYQTGINTSSSTRGVDVGGHVNLPGNRKSIRLRCPASNCCNKAFTDKYDKNNLPKCPDHNIEMELDI